MFSRLEYGNCIGIESLLCCKILGKFVISVVGNQAGGWFSPSVMYSKT